MALQSIMTMKPFDPYLETEKIHDEEREQLKKINEEELDHLNKTFNVIMSRPKCEKETISEYYDARGIVIKEHFEKRGESNTKYYDERRASNTKYYDERIKISDYQVTKDMIFCGIIIVIIVCMGGGALCWIIFEN